MTKTGEEITNTSMYVATGTEMRQLLAVVAKMSDPEIDREERFQVAEIAAEMKSDGAMCKGIEDMVTTICSLAMAFGEESGDLLEHVRGAYNRAVHFKKSEQLAELLRSVLDPTKPGFGRLDLTLAEDTDGESASSESHAHPA